MTDHADVIRRGRAFAERDARETLERWSTNPDHQAAVAVLVAQIEELERENASQAQALELQRAAWGRNIREREAAEARVKELEAARDALAEKIAMDAFYAWQTGRGSFRECLRAALGGGS